MDVCFLFIPPSGTKQAVNVALVAKVIGCIIALAFFFGVSFSFCWVSGVCPVRLSVGRSLQLFFRGIGSRTPFRYLNTVVFPCPSTPYVVCLWRRFPNYFLGAVM